MYNSIKFKGYKLFSINDFIEISGISSINVIIGKNNCGKSSLLDIIEMAYDIPALAKGKKEVQEIIADVPITQEMVTAIFAGYSSIGSLGTPSSYWNNVKGKDISVKLSVKKHSYSDDWEGDATIIPSSEILGSKRSEWQRAIHCLNMQRGEYCFRRLAADRNIEPEMETEMDLMSTGEGASNIVRIFLNNSLYNETIIEKDLLLALNEIMYPESEFISIKIQQISDLAGKTMWEIFLQEKGSQRVALSKTGSGIKTIILMLLNLLVVPKMEKYKAKKIVYGFEELENNLHPALQRKLFDYIYKFAVENDVCVFLTTHSHVAINTFYNKKKANIFHISKKNNISHIKKIETYLDKTEILNDLDVKASDILQSNGIIWVEGPSDRIYIKRWMEILTDNIFLEGKHYQFLYYGGRLLSQYAAKEETELINILTTNRNAAIVIDSDKRYASASLNETKKRIIEEFTALNMFSWVTKGKEIENYIPVEAISDFTGKKIDKQCQKYELFSTYIKPFYNSFEGKKVQFANQIKEYITTENSKEILDLNKQVLKLYDQIRLWNENC